MTNERKNIMKSETVEEFKAAVAENGLVLSDEKAAEYFAKLKSGELSALSVELRRVSDVLAHANSAAELKALAKENGIILTDEQATQSFAKLCRYKVLKSGELSEEELTAVAGGGCFNQTEKIEDIMDCLINGQGNLI